jgi:hypothetical protein
VARPLILIHGYSDKGASFLPLSTKLQERDIALIDVNICSYVSLNNEITIKDIAEGLERAFRNHEELKDKPDFEFDAIVHSTGMLVLRSWLTNYGITSTSANPRLKRLKHLVGLAPATWGSPQAHKGRTWLGALVKGNKQDFLGPDFLNAGDRVLEGLELGSNFTWGLAHIDLLGPEPYYDTTPATPFVAVFIGNQPYDGVASIANDPGTDGTVRWAGTGLNARKIRIDLTRNPSDLSGKPAAVIDGVPQRVWITEFAKERLNVPMLAVDGRNHGTILKSPLEELVDLIARFLRLGDPPDAPGPNRESYDDWLKDAKAFGEKGLAKMRDQPDPNVFHRLFHHSTSNLAGWQQFIVHAQDGRGDPVTDYMIEVLKDGQRFEPISEDVHAYGPDPSYRCFHIQLPEEIMRPDVKLRARIHASTGTDLMTYQGYNLAQHQLTAESEPVELDLNLGSRGTLFFPFTTTLIEIILNREPKPLNLETAFALRLELKK